MQDENALLCCCDVAGVTISEDAMERKDLFELKAKSQL